MGRISMVKGEGRLFHNRREYEKEGKTIPENIDTSRTCENITLVDRDITQAYDEIFGEALKKYNDKQKRSDRKIASYYEHIKKSKNGEKLFYENIVQWGSMEDFKDPQTRKRATEALVEYAKGFAERNPNLILIGAYIHLDEASPHLHLDYIPVASGFTRGLAIRNSLDKAMKQMGFEPQKESNKNNATKMWIKNERAVFGNICRSRGLVVDAEGKSRGKNLSPQEYKRAKDKMSDDIKQERENLIVKVEQLEKDNKAKDKQITELKDENNNLKQKIHSLGNKLMKVFKTLANIVMAVKMLKYDKDNGYGALLTKKSERLIDGVVDYGVKCAIDADYSEFAKEMDMKIGISEDINKYIEPREQEYSRGL